MKAARLPDAVRPRLPADPVERGALLLGLALTAASLGTLAVLWAGDPALGRGLATQWAAHFMIGKETGIPVGLAAGVPAPLAALAAFAQDAVTLLLGYPLACAIGRGTLRIGWLERLVHRPHPLRDAFARRTTTTGIALLAASLWLPFLPSGALVAGLAGRALGYPPRILLPVLLASGLAASITFAWLFSAAIAYAGSPWLVAGAALAVALLALGAATVAERARRAPEQV